MKEKIESLKLKNGLKVIFVTDKRFTNSTVQMIFKIGWRHDEEKYLGLAHLFEHLIGKRTLKYPGKSEFDKVREENGIVSNAYTSPDSTAYYQNQIPSKILKSVELLFEAIYNTTFKNDDLEKEKKVVLTEAKEYLDNDDSLLYFEMLKKLFSETSMSKFFFGTEETLKNITNEVFENFYEIYKNPKNCFLIIGNNTEKDNKKIINYLEGFYKNTPSPSLKKRGIVPKINDEIVELKEREFEILKKDKEQANIRLAYKIPNLNIKERVAWVVMKRILVGAFTSRLMKKLRDVEGLIYGIGLHRDTFAPNISYMYFATNTKKEKVKELVSIIESEIDKMILDVTEDEVKKVIPIVEYYESREVNVGSVVSDVISAEIYDEDYLPSEEYLKMVENVKGSDVKKLLIKLFKTQKPILHTLK